MKSNVIELQSKKIYYFFCNKCIDGMKVINWRKLTFFLLFFCGILALITKIWSIFHLPLGIADESWYWYLIQKQKAAYGTSFALYFNIFKEISVGKLRFISFILEIISTIIFSFALFALFRKQIRKIDLLWLVPASLSIEMLMTSIYVSVPSYITLDFFWGLLIISCFFIAYSYQGIIRKSLIFFFGFCSTQMLFNMPPAILYITLIFCFFLMIDIKSMKWMIAGFIIGIIFYFSFIQSFENFVFQIKDFFSLSKNVNDHTSKHLIKWVIKTTKFFIQSIVIPGIAIISIYKTHRKKIKICYGIFLFTYFVVLLMLSVYKSLFSTANGICIESIYILFILTVCLSFSEYTKHIKLSLICVSFSPVLLCLGTDVNFQIRGLCYAIMLIIPIIILSKINQKSEIDFFVFCMIVALCSIFFSQFNAKSWATGEKFFTTTKSLEPWKIDIPTTKTEFEKIKTFEKYTKEVKYVVGAPDVWQYIVTLKKEPTASAFRYSKDDLRNFFEKQKIKKENIVFFEYLPENDCYIKDWIQKYGTYFGSNNVKRIALSSTCNLLFFL